MNKEDKYTINDENIQQEVEKFFNQNNEVQNNNGLFIAKPMNDWIKEAETQPIPKMLFGEFWFETEVCILFSDTNLGKSILAYQIADSITSCKFIMGLKMEAEPQKVLYFDFELSKKQLHSRYSDSSYKDPYLWSPNFIRSERDPDNIKPSDVNQDNYLNNFFRKEIEKCGAKIIIIDNITAIRNETEKARDAIPLMCFLRDLKNKFNLSILVIAHTPKRDLSRPITENDASGSKQLLNLADNAFTIGRSHKDENLRYLKQIKPKFTPSIYGYDNVLTCSIDKRSNFTEFVFQSFDKEAVHLKQRSDKEDLNITQEIYTLHDEGKSSREIADIVEMSHTTVNRKLKKRQTEKSLSE